MPARSGAASAPCCAAPAASWWRSATTGGSARRSSSTRWSKASPRAAATCAGSAWAPTPMLYYAEASAEEVDGGIQITGSHNPANYNGFKMVFQGRPFFGEDIQTIGAMAAAGDWDDGTGSVEQLEVMDAYIDRLVGALDGIYPDRLAAASHRLGRGQRRRRPGARSAGRAAPGRALHALHRGRRQLPQPSPRSHRAREPRRPAAARSPRRTSTSALPSTATATASARSTARAGSSGATSC